MKERPILFSAPMVRAILAGNKTVTRRLVKPAPQMVTDHSTVPWDGEPADLKRLMETNNRPCPYGQPGDRLWVREAWGVVSHAFNEDGEHVDWTPDRPAKPIREMRFGSRGYYTGHVIYAADGHFEWTDDDDGELRSAWKPSIHMPRIASRITLEITGVRVERLQDITVDGAIAEGMHPAPGLIGDDDLMVSQTMSLLSPSSLALNAPLARFALLWGAINGPDSWDANPWVWVVEFKRIPQEQTA